MSKPAFLVAFESRDAPDGALMHMEFGQLQGVIAKIESMMPEACEQFPNAITFIVIVRISSIGTEIFIHQLEPELPSDRLH